ncbi:MAG: hypothetical protein KIT79_09610 [Deltaproteobacteria bacterium]|nr:hypothetical protein [Deltaproteobacteria bacterium]
MNPSLREVVAAHGGMERWASCETIEAILSTDGLAFRSRFQGGKLIGKPIHVEPRRRVVRIDNYPAQGYSGIWTPDVVSIRSESDVVLERESPRSSFEHFSRNFRWDAADLLYFCGYALWNYLSFPWLLTEPGMVIRDRRSNAGDIILDAVFPDNFPTHCRNQSFQFSPEGLLLRHDYTADVIGRWAAAANFCLEHQRAGGLRIYTNRKVVPRIGAFSTLPGPLLVWIRLADIRVNGFPSKEIS